MTLNCIIHFNDTQSVLNFKNYIFLTINFIEIIFHRIYYRIDFQNDLNGLSIV